MCTLEEIKVIAILISIALSVSVWGDDQLRVVPRATAVSNSITSCNCREVRCEKGAVASCNVTCDAPRQASCSCDAGCNSASGNTSGSNICKCN